MNLYERTILMNVEAIINLIQMLYNSLGMDRNVNVGDLWGIASIFFMLVVIFITIFKKRPEIAKVEVEEKKVPTKPVEKVEVVPWPIRLKNGLARSRQEVWGKLDNLFSGAKLDDDILENIEELLYGADIGPTMVTELIDQLQEKAKTEDIGAGEFKKFLYDFLYNRLKDVQEKIDPSIYEYSADGPKGTKVIMVVGVNGAGKTTTIGKLATKLKLQGAKVVVGACDTFRAAAVDQLQVWCDRAGAHMIRAKEGTNPSGVAYESLQEALKMEADYCILDTAGRLHTKGNLMEELKKNKRVLQKLDPKAPNEVFLVVDAITGQNAIKQAEEFNKALDLSGLIFTKCDGSSKAGGAVGIVQQLKVPIVYIGVGETVDDINVFNLDEYLGALLNL
ncbi:MAG: signal recognition particle-docking protein FtsY [Bacteriovoracaceae bacterium]|nr:signal recognition particle-docking protein FtsY [Bacteriovoracaceae bacterium]